MAADELDPSIGAIEIKITARAQDEDVVRAALDSADVELFDAGVVLRARLRP